MTKAKRNVVTLFPLIGTGSSGEGRVRSPEARYAAKQMGIFYSVCNGQSFKPFSTFFFCTQLVDYLSNRSQKNITIPRHEK
jgi:hypothetical protein